MSPSEPRPTPAENRRAAALVMRWLRTETEPLPRCSPGTSSSELYRAFVSWTYDQGVSAHAPSPTKWGRILNDVGIPHAQRTSRGKRRALGLLATRRRLEAEEARADSHPGGSP